jgi:HEAT repeat protein
VKFLTQVQRNSGAVEAQLTASLKVEDPLARAGAAQVLGQAQVGSAVEDLLDATEDSVSEVRCNAVIALGKIAAPGSRSRLQDLLDDSDATVSYYAEWALRQLGQS